MNGSVPPQMLALAALMGGCVQPGDGDPEWKPVSSTAHQVSTHVAIERFDQRCNGELSVTLPEGVSARLLGTPESDGPIRGGGTAIRVPPGTPIDLEFRLTLSTSSVAVDWKKALGDTELLCDPKGRAELLPVHAKSVSAYLKYDHLCSEGAAVMLSVAPDLVGVDIEPDLKNAGIVVSAAAGAEHEVEVPVGATDARLTTGEGEAALLLTETHIRCLCGA